MLEKLYLEKFGAEDYAQVREVRRWLMQNRELLTLDWPAIRAAARQWAQTNLSLRGMIASTEDFYGRLLSR